jgi:short-subunit dehydrogenase involved in D-alanine esterification of teichoic acids
LIYALKKFLKDRYIMKNIKDSVLIFAGSGGLGLEICKKFLQEDFDVYFTSQNNIKIRKIINLLKRKNIFIFHFNSL